MTNMALKLSENLRNFGVKSAYGDPVEVDGVTIVPVALVQFGFGGGSEGGQPTAGSEDHAEEAPGGPEGAGGGGGGGMALPIGAYVRSAGTVRFEPNLIALLAVGIPFVWVSGRALARIIRSLKR